MCRGFMPILLFVTLCRGLKVPEFCEIQQDYFTKISRAVFIFLKISQCIYSTEQRKFSPVLTII